MENTQGVSDVKNALSQGEIAYQGSEENQEGGGNNNDESKLEKKPLQSKEENAQFADNRRKQELETALAQMQELEKQIAQQNTQLEYAENNDQMLENSSSEELQFYKSRVLEQVLLDDISKIKQKYSDIEDINDLPEGYLEIMATGMGLDPVAVYEILIPKKETPPSSGSVKSTQPLLKDYYTSHEVDMLGDKELSNPKILDRVLKSMTKW